MEKKIFAFMMPVENIDYLNMNAAEYNGYVGFNRELITDYTGYDPIDFTEFPDTVKVQGVIMFDTERGTCEFTKRTPIIPLTEIPVDFYKYRIIGFSCQKPTNDGDMYDFESIKDETMFLYDKIVKLIEHEEHRDKR